jgi:hypothetical protein
MIDPRNLNMNRMTVAEAAYALSRTGSGEVTEAMIRDAVEAGCPVSGDGTINVMHLAAWLNREMTRGADESA